jgi:hypothetical protein
LTWSHKRGIKGHHNVVGIGIHYSEAWGDVFAGGGSTPVKDIGGAFVTADENTNRRRLPQLLTVPPAGMVDGSTAPIKSPQYSPARQHSNQLLLPLNMSWSTTVRKARVRNTTLIVKVVPTNAHKLEGNVPPYLRGYSKRRKSTEQLMAEFKTKRTAEMEAMCSGNMR